jgi:hypothetical protein
MIILIYISAINHAIHVKLNFLKLYKNILYKGNGN